MYSPALSGAGTHRNGVRRTPRREIGNVQQQQQRDGSTRRRRHRSWVDHDGGSSSPSRGSESIALLVDNDRGVSDTNRGNRRSWGNWCIPHQLGDFTNALMYGIINSILTIPCMYGYAAIIFSHPAFTTFMPALSKLVMLSSVVHQVMFTLLSSLPFAIGQVQDAGLIFLSAIATSICNSLGPEVSLEAKVTTTVVTIGLATASLGAVLVLLGKFRLAGLVSYLPMPVVGGYLAYIGLFCLYAGLSLCTGLVINDFTSMMQIWDMHYMILCIPGALGGVVLLLVAQRCENSFALPATILLMPVLFFVVLPLCGISLEEARDYGWVAPVSAPAGFVQMLDLFDFSQMYWGQVPVQFTTWLGMTFVVAFSSCLDVAAIEMDMGSQLNINHELKSVGWANVVSGLLGGYTGSYIFSQTIFTYRSKTNSRVVGVCVIISEFAIVLVPLSVMSLVPRFFFAAVLIFIAVDLMTEWLVHVYHKILPREYIVLWLSFIAINMVSLELGMVLGIGFAILNFMIGYAQVRVVARRSRSSAAVRKLAARTLLGQKRDAIVYLELYGYLFFGSSVQVLEDVQKAVYIRKPRTDKKQKSSKKLGVELPVVDDSSIPLTPVSKRDVPIVRLDGSPAPHPDGLPTEFVVMDFSRVSGMDATAARSAFMTLQQHCKRHGITVLFADVLPDIRSLLLKNEIVDEGSFFSNADAALEFSENRLLLHTDHVRDFHHAHESMSVLLHRFIGEPDESPLFTGIDQFFRKYEVPADYEFYRVASYPDRFYFLASGRVALFMNDDGSVAPGKPLVPLENVMPGAMFGEVDFFGRQHRYMAATAIEPCTVFEMTRQSYESMDGVVPKLWNRLRDVVMQSMALSITNTTSINTLNSVNGHRLGCN
uniref:Sulfate transporter n=1 Tax=Peronospora matthiolae TaxID=2874970 RepID=A0AAV1UN57_9STRA